jgi:hypothetical protein
VRRGRNDSGLGAAPRGPKGRCPSTAASDEPNWPLRAEVEAAAALVLWSVPVPIPLKALPKSLPRPTPPAPLPSMMFWLRNKRAPRLLRSALSESASVVSSSTTDPDRKPAAVVLLWLPIAELGKESAAVPPGCEGVKVHAEYVPSVNCYVRVVL